MTLTTSNFNLILFVFILGLCSQVSFYAQSNCDILCPNDFSILANSNGEYVVEDYFANNTVALEDECNAGAVVIQSPAPGTVVGLGEFEVTMTVLSGGASDDCDFDITVVQTQEGDCDFDCPEDQTGSTDGNGNFIIPNFATNGALEVTGNCGNFTYEQNPPAGTLVTVGDYNISLSATSGSGNSSISCSFDLTVDGTTPPDNCEVTTFSFFPNPASSEINFSTEVDVAMIISMRGNVVGEAANTTVIDVSSITRGIYLLRLQKCDRTIVRRIAIL